MRRAAVALLALGALLTSVAPATADVPTAPSTVDKSAKVARPDSPTSGRLVPALRGEAARAATGPELNEKFRKRGEARHATRASGPVADRPGTAGRQVGATSIPPWSGALHAAWGAFPNVNSDGAMATHTLNPGISIPPGNPDVVYAPTLDPSGKTCIEVTTFYWQGGNGVGAWDWCAAAPGFAAVAWIDATFLSKYSDTHLGPPAYTVKDVQTDPVTNSWTAYLFNYSTGYWDALFTSADPGKLTNPGGGWSMFEVYTEYNSATGEGYYCTETAGTLFAAAGISINVGGTWSLLTTTNSSVTPPGSVSSASLGCTGLSFSLPSANDYWQVTN
ncbi:hypothetical protein ABZ816_00850 [Actinosynnema sp. NPDC047251]|uniref:hypothetical protein n=1 Tax=Saccharothrix espanaensis TaxID=103731 RepID=UPI0002F3AC14|nr:hypothetical protein [Saccharothrix espanaensis]